MIFIYRKEKERYLTVSQSEIANVASEKEDPQVA